MANDLGRYLPLPVLFWGYFECKHCHRPIPVHAYLLSEDDWQDLLRDAICPACGQGETNRPCREVAEKSVVRWNRKVRSLSGSVDT
jgi:hypothetical protein